jgi:hypothetical protein
MAPANRPTRRRIEAPFLRSVVATLLLVMLAVMIVRDILVRRWGAERQPQSDVTQRSH